MRVKCLLKSSFFVLTWLIMGGLSGGVASAETVFTIGNSLTWDTQPAMLDNSQWHVFCNKNLQSIHDNPTNHCIGSSRLWTDALVNDSFDYVTVQPFFGTTFQQDFDVISQWMQLQPNAQFVLHTGWNGPANHAAIWQSLPADLESTSVTTAYFDKLELALESANPGRNLYRTKSADILTSIASDIDRGQSPLGSLDELYRDSIHMSADGQYLMNNMMRFAVNQPLNLIDENNATPVQLYLNRKISVVAVPEPNSIFVVSALLGTALLLNYRSKSRFRVRILG